MNEKISNYEELLLVATSLKEIEKKVSCLSNASALLNFYLDNINWVGFYYVLEDGLYLGPFQGLTACTRLALDKGVCSFAVREERIVNVPNVHEFKTHIACDSKSNSEIVLPIYENDKIVLVLDIDSPIFNRFDEVDEKYLAKFVAILTEAYQKATEIFF